MNARERYLASAGFGAVAEHAFTRANRAWLALDPKFRGFLARLAGLDSERGDASLQQLSEAERAKLYEVNAKMLRLAGLAAGSLQVAALCHPPLPKCAA